VVAEGSPHEIFRRSLTQLEARHAQQPGR
jgi:hypothetical protein